MSDDNTPTIYEDDQGTVSFPQGESKSFEPIPSGLYMLHVHQIEQKNGPAAPYWELQAVTSSSNPAWDGKRIWENISFKAQFRFQQLGDAVYGPLPIGAQRSLNKNELIGESFVATVSVGPDNKGELRNEIGRMHPRGVKEYTLKDGTVVPADPKFSPAMPVAAPAPSPKTPNPPAPTRRPSTPARGAPTAKTPTKRKR